MSDETFRRLTQHKDFIMQSKDLPFEYRSGFEDAVKTLAFILNKPYEHNSSADPPYPYQDTYATGKPEPGVVASADDEQSTRLSDALGLVNVHSAEINSLSRRVNELEVLVAALGGNLSQFRSEVEAHDD